MKTTNPYNNFNRKALKEVVIDHNKRAERLQKEKKELLKHTQKTNRKVKKRPSKKTLVQKIKHKLRL